MKLRLIAAAAAALLLAGNAVAQDTSTEKGKLSYALGYDLGRNAVESGEQIDINAVTINSPGALDLGNGDVTARVPVPWI